MVKTQDRLREKCDKYENGGIIDAEEVLQTTVISAQIYQQVLTHNIKL